MKVAIVLAPLLFLSFTPVFAQESGFLTENPLQELKDTIDRVLEEAGLEFTPAQNREITLMMDERRRASEELFGNLQDFAAGPTQAQQADETRSAIVWMQGEFLDRIDAFLTPDQESAWENYVSDGRLEAVLATDRVEGDDSNDQTHYVRIHADAYTSEDDSYRLGRNSNGNSSRTEVIQRGGAGAFHGNVEFLLRDDALNARNPFAPNKPDSQERQLSIDVSGPVVANRLTTGISFFQNEAENVDTIVAELPEGIFERGIVRPTTTRSYETTNTLQLGESSAIDIGGEYFTSKGENQGIGGFTLPDRAYTTEGDAWSISVGQFSILPGNGLFEYRFGINSETENVIPATDAFQVNVLDAFNRGGAQNASETLNRNYEFSGMYTRIAGRWTMKSGIEGAYRTRRSDVRTNFGGTFTFSSLEDFQAGEPILYSVQSGEPLLELSQLEAAFFTQNDIQLTPQFTLMLGLRYLTQTELDDNDNLAPRISFAWGLTPTTVLRGGAAVFYHTYGLNVREAQERLDGVRQFETIIAQPDFVPNPLGSGSVVETFPSIRVTDPNLQAPYEIITGLQLEKTFFTNLFVNAAYHMRTELRRHQLRDINAPLPPCIARIPSDLTPAEENAFIQTCRPTPSSGVILNLEPTGEEEEHIFRLNYRQRFSIFNVQSRYTMNITFADSFPSNNASIPSDSYDLRSDWGRAPFPVHQLESTVNAELPLGIFLLGRYTAESGRGYSILTGRDDNRDGRVSDRPPGVARNGERGPAFYSVDFNISKAFFFGNGDQNINVFANMSNAFNRLNPGTPSGVLTSPNFGRSTSAQNPREIELGLRYQF